MRWLFVVVLLRAGKTGVATLQQLLCIGQRFGFTGEPQHCLRRRAHSLPGCGPRRRYKSGWAQARYAAELDTQQPLAVPQVLSVA
ncbi:hypothetical protein D3C80_1982690 [compost metagenome]